MNFKVLEQIRNLRNLSVEQFVDGICSHQTYYNWREKGEVPNGKAKLLIDKYGSPESIVSEPDRPYGNTDKPIGKAVLLDDKTPPIITPDPGGKQIPFYSVEVFATISPAMGDVVALKPDTFIRIPMFSQGQYAVQVTGHSMKGYINHADWVVIRKITERSEIIYGEPYLIVTKADNLKTVKFIKAGDSPDTFWLVPYNIEQFEPQEIKKSSILELYRVIGVFKSV